MKFKSMFLISIFLLASCANNVSTSVSELPPIDSIPETNTSEDLSITKPPRPHNHNLSDWQIIEEADLFNTGIKERHCLEDSYSETMKYYDLSEVQFSDKTYQYSGQEKELRISGLLPKGISVIYENNKLTNIGTILAKANFVDEMGDVIETKEAYLSVVSYQGFPRIDIHTIENAGIYSKDIYTQALIDVSNCETKYEMQSESAGVRLRGNGTLEANKKPYRIKFDNKQNVLGLNDGAKAKNWVLLAEYYDYSMLRNATAFMLSDSLLDNKGYYSSDFKHVNLYINDIFNGVYVLAEQQQVNKNRIDIYEPEENETNVDIGYLLEIDEYKDGPVFYVDGSPYPVTDSNGTSNKIPTRSYALKSDIYTNEQLEYIGKYTINVFDIFYRAAIKGEYCTLDENNNVIKSNFTNAYDTINNVINVDSLMRMYILQEIMKNIDVGYSSFYLYVDFSSSSKFNKMTFGAPWDFDWSSGNVNDGNCYPYDKQYNSTFTTYTNPWLLLLSKTNFFESLIKEYWSLFINSGIFDFTCNQIEDISKTYEEDFNRNFQKWNVLGTAQHGYHTGDVYNMRSQLDASNYLKRWLENRVNYLSSIW